MAHERICGICGTEYRYCAHCNEFNSNETWRYMYHDENCRAIANIYHAYQGNEISKEEAKERMSKYPENLKKIFDYNATVVSKTIRSIFDIPEDEQEKEDKKEDSENLVEDVPVNKLEQQKMIYKNNYKHNKK